MDGLFQSGSTDRVVLLILLRLARILSMRWVVFGNLDTHDASRDTWLWRRSFYSDSVDYALRRSFPFPAAIEDLFRGARVACSW